jgi:hypothetical protein
MPEGRRVKDEGTALRERHHGQRFARLRGGSAAPEGVR